MERLDKAIAQHSAVIKQSHSGSTPNSTSPVSLADLTGTCLSRALHNSKNWVVQHVPLNT